MNKDQLSIFNNELKLGVSLPFLISVNFLCFILIVLARYFLRKEKEWSKAIDIGTLMVLAGAICSMADKVFWKGSLDYLLLFTKICDLKDIYMFLGLFICILDLCRQFVRKLRK